MKTFLRELLTEFFPASGVRFLVVLLNCTLTHKSKVIKRNLFLFQIFLRSMTDEDQSFLSVTCKASPNIALIKYWGKRDEDLILPDNDSLSITLDSAEIFSKTTVSTSSKMTADRFFFHEIEQSKLPSRMKKVLDEIRRRFPSIKHKFVEIRSENNFPASTGLASSASAFACLAVALTNLFQLEPRDSLAAFLARIGSGSAVRSVYGGFVRWSSRDECLSSSLFSAEHWAELRIVILIFNSEKKPVSSTDAMQRTRQTSTLFPARLATIDEKIQNLIQAIEQKDFRTFAKIVMTDSSQFHAVCLDTYPPVIYLNEQSKHLIDLVHAFNQILNNENIRVAYTFDAGPNPFCFLRQQDLDEFLSLLKHFYPSDNPQVHRNVQDSQFNFSNVNLQVLPNVLERIVLTKIGSGPSILS